MANKFAIGVRLKAFTDNQSRGAIDSTKPFHLARVELGHEPNFLKTENGIQIPDKSKIPTALAVTPNKFATITQLIRSYADGVITIRATLEGDTFGENDSFLYSTATLVDSYDTIVAVFVGQPFYANKNRLVTLELVLSQIDNLEV